MFDIEHQLFAIEHLMLCQCDQLVVKTFGIYRGYAERRFCKDGPSRICHCLTDSMVGYQSVVGRLCPTSGSLPPIYLVRLSVVFHSVVQIPLIELRNILNLVIHAKTAIDIIIIINPLCIMT